MSPLTQAISQGFSPDQVIQYLIRHFPKYAKDINKALGKGFSASQVVQYLNGRKGNGELESTLTEHEKTRRTDKENQKNIERNIGKGALALGAAGLGAYGLSRMGQAVIPQVLPAVQQNFNPRESVEINATPQIAHQAKQIEFQPPNQLIQQGKTPTPPITPQTSPQAPIQNQAPQMDFGNILEQYGLKKKVDDMRNVNPPNVIAQAAKFLLHKDRVKQLESQLKVPIQQVIEGYLQSAPPVEQGQPQQNMQQPQQETQQTQQPISPPQQQQAQSFQPASDEIAFDKGFGNIGKGITENFYEGIFKSLKEGKSTFAGVKDPLISKAKPFYDKGLIKSPEDLKRLANEGFKEEKKPQAKEIGSSVLLPDGNIGEIQSLKQGIAKVNVDGKDRHKKVDDLIEMPLPAKDLADLYQDVLSGIEKKTGQEVSRNVSWAGYDPKTNELAFIPHLGALYVYKDISPEDAQQLTGFLTQRKTTGENFIGAWEQGTKSPIGAAMSQLIQRLQKQAGGKGKEYSGKYEKIYDALEPAKLEAKKKHDLEKKASKPIKEKKVKSEDEKRKTKKPRPY